MAVVKVIEILAESSDSWEAAAKAAVAEASKTVKNIQSVYIKEMQAIVEGNEIVKYRVNAKISFIIHE
ncbi:MAG: dodecin family protein [Bacillota bacterium]|nr:dodecin family protein [Bacillota bacterium]MDW7677283.1 dodecin family protein [Bacillota bacterium]